MEKHTSFVSLGSNIGHRESNLQVAFCEIAALSHTQIDDWSRIYETDPVDYVDQPSFLNGILKITTALTPEQLLYEFLNIEQHMGRVRSLRYGPRVIDLDMLFYDASVIQTTELQIPHPRLHERAFVLVPMMDIASNWLHPVMQLTVSELHGRVEGKEGVKLCPSYLQNDCAHTES